MLESLQSNTKTSSIYVFKLLTGRNGTTKKYKKVHTSLSIKIFNVYDVPFFLHLHAHLNKTKWMIFHRPLSLRSKDTSHPTRTYKYYLHTVLYFYVVSSPSRVVCCSVTHFYGMRVCCVGRSWSLHYVWFLSLFYMLLQFLVGKRQGCIEGWIFANAGGKENEMGLNWIYGNFSYIVWDLQ